MASGVSTGKISRRNTSLRCLRCCFGQVLDAAQDDAFLFQGRQQFARAGSGTASANIWRTDLADAVELLARRHAVGPGADGDARLHLLLQAADADHEELVEVGREDGQELEPFQQRHRRVLRFLQHPAIELQPAQLAIDVEGRIVEGGKLAIFANLARHGSATASCMDKSPRGPRADGYSTDQARVRVSG